MIEGSDKSIFTTLLELQVQRTQANPTSQQLRNVLMSVVKESQILHVDESMLSMDILIHSLGSDKTWSPSQTLFEFLDNCIVRVARKPVHYYDVISTLAANSGSTPEASGASHLHLDLLLFAVVEQWQFLVERADNSSAVNVATWLLRYIELSSLRVRQCSSTQSYEEVRRLLVAVRDQLGMDVKIKTCRPLFRKSLKDPPELGLSIKSLIDPCNVNDRQMNGNFLHDDEVQPTLLPEPPLFDVPQEQESHFGLTKWARENIQDAITDGAVGELFLCLSSKHTEIRQQAVTGVIRFMGQLEVKIGSAS